MKQPTHLLLSCLAAALLSGAGCSNSGEAGAPTQPTQDAGPDSDVEPPIVKEVCPGACETARECVVDVMKKPAFDLAACEAQCAKELTGTGYLIPYVALPVFRAMATVDAACDVYNIQVFEKAGMQVTEDAELHQECMNAIAARSFEPPEHHAMYPCWWGFYRFNTPIRDQMRPCFTEGTRDIDITMCMEAKVPPENSWIAGAPLPCSPWDPCYWDDAGADGAM